jgi:hypothetical protein
MARKTSTVATEGMSAPGIEDGVHPARTIRHRFWAIAAAGAVLATAGLASATVANASAAVKPHAQVYSVQIPASSSSFVDTGIDVAAGAHVAIQATGKVIYKPGNPPAGPAGFPVASEHCASGLPFGEYTNDNLSCLSLIGLMGSSPEFEVGGSLTVGSAEGGELYLMFNDNEYGDNSGDYQVTITVS